MKSTMLETRYDLPSLFRDQSTVAGVEVGTDQGVLAADWLSHHPTLFLHTVDPWLPFSENPTDRAYAEQQYRLNMARFVEPLRRSKHHKLTSVQAAARLRSSQFDFAYIDAAHDEINVRQDLDAWWPLIRVGGVLAGHDFDLHGVCIPVVDFVKRHRLSLQLICEHGGPDQAKDAGVLRPGSGMDRWGGWCHISWWARKDHAEQ